MEGVIRIGLTAPLPTQTEATKESSSSMKSLLKPLQPATDTPWAQLPPEQPIWSDCGTTYRMSDNHQEAGSACY